jgi:hypothetical protein
MNTSKRFSTHPFYSDENQTRGICWGTVEQQRRRRLGAGPAVTFGEPGGQSQPPRADFKLVENDGGGLRLDA